MNDHDDEGAAPRDDYVLGGEHAALLDRIHRRGDRLRRRRHILAGSAAVACAVLVAVPIAANRRGDAGASSSVASGDVGVDVDDAAGPSPESSAVTTVAPDPTVGCAAEPFVTACSTSTTQPLPAVTSTSETTTVPGLSTPAPTAPPGETPLTTQPIAVPVPTPPPPGPLGIATCADGSTGDAVVWVSNQSFADPTQRIEVRIDGEVLVDRDFVVEAQHTFVMFCVDLGAGRHLITASTSEDAVSVVATGGNGVVVLAWDDGAIQAETAPRWDEVGFA